MVYKKIEDKIDDKFRDLFDLFDRIKIVGKTSTIIMDGNRYYVDCSIKPIIENLTKHNNSSKKDCLPDAVTLCYACGCMTKCICGKCNAIKRSPS